MTRKHFQALAEAVASIIDSYERKSVGYPRYSSNVHPYDWIIDPVLKVCRKANPNFSSARFIEAVKKELKKSLDTVTA